MKPKPDIVTLGPHLGHRLEEHECFCSGIDPPPEVEPDCVTDWRPWQPTQRGRCDACGDERDLMCMHRRESNSDVCFECFIYEHAENCGCDLWAWAQFPVLDRSAARRGRPRR
jgi:hypothetical protein